MTIEDTVALIAALRRQNKTPRPFSKDDEVKPSSAPKKSRTKFPESVRDESDPEC